MPSEREPILSLASRARVIGGDVDVMHARPSRVRMSTASSQLPATASRMSAAERLLSSLKNVRRFKESWRADCPLGHSSRGSLSVSEGDDGRVLLHCFAGCGAAEIVVAVGLSLADLYPEKPRDLSPMGRTAARAAMRESGWRAALGVLVRESLIVLLAARETQRNPLTAEEVGRLALAVERIQSAREVLTA